METLALQSLLTVVGLAYFAEKISPATAKPFRPHSSARGLWVSTDISKKAFDFQLQWAQYWRFGDQQRAREGPILISASSLSNGFTIFVRSLLRTSLYLQMKLANSVPSLKARIYKKKGSPQTFSNSSLWDDNS